MRVSEPGFNSSGHVQAANTALLLPYHHNPDLQRSALSAHAVHAERYITAGSTH